MARRVRRDYKNTMASGTSGKPAGALDGFLEHHRIAASAFRRQGFGQFQVPLVNGGVSVGAQALLRERCNVGGKSFCCGSRLSIRHHPICKPHRLCFFRINRSTGQNHIHGVAVANDAWQAHGASIDQWYPQRRQNTPKVADSSTTRRSHISASSSPLATA